MVNVAIIIVQRLSIWLAQQKSVSIVMAHHTRKEGAAMCEYTFPDAYKRTVIKTEQHNSVFKEPVDLTVTWIIDFETKEWSFFQSFEKTKSYADGVCN